MAADKRREFYSYLTNARGCIHDLEPLLASLATRIDAAKPEEACDVDAELNAIDYLIWRHNDLMESARDTWLRENLGSEEFTELDLGPTPVSLDLPLFTDKQQAERAKVQCKQIGERLKQRITLLDRVFIAAKILEGAGDLASIALGGGVLYRAFKVGGRTLLKKTIIKTAVAGGISYIAGKAVDAGLRATGASEETIQGVKHAAELVTWLLILRKIHKSLPARVEPIKSAPKTSAPTVIQSPSQQRLTALPAPKTSRAIQDRTVKSAPPPVLALNRRISGSMAQQRALQVDTQRILAEGGYDIRVNQQQVNALGKRVGLNRPDLQYTKADGTRVYVEYDNATPGSFPNTPRGPMHAARILANDPLGVIELRRFP